MTTVYIPHQLQALTGGVGQVEIEAETLRQVIRELEGQFPGLGPRLATAEGLVPGLMVSIDGALPSSGLLSRIAAAREVHFLPALGGG